MAILNWTEKISQYKINRIKEKEKKNGSQKKKEK